MSRIINKGERFVLSSGDYSDYRVLTIADASETFDIDFCRKEYRQWAAAKNIEEHGFNEYQFLAWLVVVRGLLIEVSVGWKEWHLSRYAEEKQELSLWQDGRWDADWPGDYARKDVEKANGQS